jgi:hypothetical protein
MGIKMNVRVLRGFLAMTDSDVRYATKITENGKTYYEIWYGGYRVFLAPEDVEEIAPIETYWFVREVSTATPENKNFAGEVHTYIIGKDSMHIYEDVPGGFHNGDWTKIPYFIHKYGYKRPCDARRSYAYRHPQNDESWKTTVKLVSIDVQKDNNGVYHVV